jgi:hypothetical protein
LLIPLHAAPLLRDVRRFFGGPASPAEIAFEQEVLCASEDSELNPSVFLDGQIEKILGTPAESHLDAEIDHVSRRTVRSAPTIAYHIKDAVLLDGSIYAGRMRHVIGKKNAALSKKIVHLDTGAISSSAAGSTYFGHWLADDVLAYMLAERYSKPVCCSPNSSFEHRPLYARIFGQDWTATDRAHIEHLILFQDFAQTSLKRHRQLELRRKILAQFEPSVGNHLIYLKRGNTGASRPVANEQEIIDELSRRGFTILDIRTDSLDRILSHLVSAKIVVSVEGSQTYHGAYSLPRGSALLLLQPPGRFTATQRDWSENIGVRFGFVVGDQRENSTYFPLNDILKTVDLFFKDKA